MGARRQTAYGTGSVLLLALFFGVGAWDAWLQMTGAATTMLTVWTGLGAFLVGLACRRFTQVAVAAFTRADAPQSEPLDLARATRCRLDGGGGFLSAPLCSGTRRPRRPDQVLQADLRRFLVGPFGCSGDAAVPAAGVPAPAVGAHPACARAVDPLGGCGDIPR